MRRSQWRQRPERKTEARELSAQYGLNPVVAHVLLNRGVPAADFPSFLAPAPAGYDALLLTDLEPAAERLAQAVEQQQKVVIYGDYDADGCCAGALLSRYLRHAQVPYEYYVPDRFDEGYGVNAAALLRIVTQHKPALIVTVDCGIGSAAEIDTVCALGTDVLVTDHHQVPDRLPKVPAVDPHRPDSTYPFKDLCGTAVAYKLCEATAARVERGWDEVEPELFELVCLGTIADVMPLLGENRWFAHRGLRLVAETRSVGLRALLEVAGLAKDGTLSARDVGFGLGPRINAAGRLESASAAYRLLVTDDRHEACELAESLERLNRERKEVEARVVEEAADQLREVSLDDTWGLVVAAEGWHEGVLGLVAGRLCRQHHRPVLALALNGTTAKGSGRSTPAVNLHGALTACSELLTRFGGHPRAAGLGLELEQLPALREAFNTAVKAQITADELVPTIDVECALRGTAANLELAEALTALAPYGEGHPEPVFEVRGLRVGQAKATRDGSHLQLMFEVESNQGRRELKGFWPRMGQYVDRFTRGAPVTVAGSLTVDTWQGRRPQLMVEDLRLGGD